MKINIAVRSVLLEKTLQAYLREYIVSYDECDFIIADENLPDINKPICLVSFDKDSDVKRPFCKDSLLEDLQKFDAQIQVIQRINTQKFNNIFDLNEIEKLKNSIESINDNTTKDNIQNEIENIVKDFTSRLYEIITKNNQK